MFELIYPKTILERVYELSYLRATVLKRLCCSIGIWAESLFPTGSWFRSAALHRILVAICWFFPYALFLLILQSIKTFWFCIARAAAFFPEASQSLTASAALCLPFVLCSLTSLSCAKSLAINFAVKTCACLQEQPSGVIASTDQNLGSNSKSAAWPTITKGFLFSQIPE